MPYKVRFDGGVNSGKIFTLPDPLLLSSLSAGSSCRVEVDFDLNTIGTDHTLLFNVGDYSYIRILPSGVIRAGYSIQSGFGDIVDSSAQTLVAGQKYTVAFDLSQTRQIAQVWLNGVLIGSASNRWGTFRLKDMGIWAGTSALNGHIYALRAYANGSLVDNYDVANISSGTTIPDLLGGPAFGQAGTWPANDGEWIFYSDGAYELTAQGGTYSYTGASAGLSTARNIEANGGTYSYSGASASVSINRQVDATGATYSYSGASSDVAYNRFIEALGGTFSYFGASASLTYVQLNSYLLTALGATYSYQGAQASLTATGVIPQANPSAFVVSAYIGGIETVKASVGGVARINAIIDSRLTINARLSQ